jgi:hypothetical protein
MYQNTIQYTYVNVLIKIRIIFLPDIFDIYFAVFRHVHIWQQCHYHKISIIMNNLLDMHMYTSDGMVQLNNNRQRFPSFIKALLHEKSSLRVDKLLENLLDSKINLITLDKF